MRYVITECSLPEDLSTALGHKQFQSLITKATAAGISWEYSFGGDLLEIRNAPSGLEGKLSQYGKVEVLPDA